ncbi:MAG: lipopolysaccharide biosynthesis protein [Cytophagales bacterium]|nr:lipopolysaccharide biosynthesis protein [Cytophagales bacterium]
MSILKKLASEAALYGLPSIVGRSVYFLLVALHTRAFAPAESGVQAELFAYVAFLQVVYTFGMETSFFRFASRDNSKQYYNLILSAVIAVSGAFTLFFVLFATPLINLLGYPGRESYLIMLALVVALDGIVAIPFARLRLERKPRRFAFVRMANILLNVLLNVFFLLFCRDIHAGRYLTFLQPVVNVIYKPEFGVGYIFLANLIANLAFIPLLWDLFSDFRFRFDAAAFRPVWLYGYPILIMGLAGVANQMFDRLTLKALLPDGFYPGRSSEAALGIYASCYKLSVLMNVVVQAFRYAAEPFFFSQAADKNAPGTFALVMKWFIIACCVLWVGISLNLDWLAPMFLRQPAYLEGLAVVPVLLLGNLLLGVYYNLTVWFKLTDRTRYGTWLTFLGAGVNILLNIMLIPVIGYMGCAVAFLLSCAAMTVACYLLGNKYLPVPYSLRSAGFYVGSAAVLVFGLGGVSVGSPLTTAFFQMAVVVAYVAAVVYFEKVPIAKLNLRRR